MVDIFNLLFFLEKNMLLVLCHADNVRFGVMFCLMSRNLPTTYNTGLITLNDTYAHLILHRSCFYY